MAEKKTRYTIEAISNLNTVVIDLAQIIELQKLQVETTRESSGKIVSAINEQKAAYDKLKTTQKELTLSQAQEARVLTAQIANAKALADQRIQEAKRTTAQVTAEARSSAEQTIQEAKRTTAQVSAEASALASKQVVEARKAATLEVIEARTSAKERILALRQTGESVDTLGDKLTGLAKLAAAAFSIQQARQFTNEVIDAKTKIDVFQQALLSMVGNKLLTDKINAELVQMALESPFEVEELFQTTLKLKAMGVETNNLIPYMEALGNMAALVGKDRLPLIAKAMTDVQNKNTLMAQEIRQFTDNGIPLYDLLAKSMNKTKDEVISLAETHQIKFKDVEQAILQASQKGGLYYNQMAIQANALGGIQSNLADKFFVSKAKIGDFFETTLRNGLTVYGKLIDATIGSETAIGRLVDIVKSATAAFVTYQVATNGARVAQEAAAIASAAWNAVEKAGLIIKGEWILATSTSTFLLGAYTAEQEAAIIAARTFNATLASNPFTLVALALGTLVTGYYAYKASVAEVVDLNGQETQAIIKQEVALKSLVSQAINAKAGTEERTLAIQRLQKEYPSLLGNIDSEKITNKQLEGILIGVNNQFERKIRLSVASAKAESLAQQAVEIETKRQEVLLALREQNQALSSQYISDVEFIKKVQEQLPRGSVVVGEQGEVQTLTSNAKKIQSYQELSKEVSRVYKDIESASNRASLIQKQNGEAEIADLKTRLAQGLITRTQYEKALQDLGVQTKNKTLLTEQEIADLAYKTEKEVTKNKKEELQKRADAEIKAINESNLTHDQAASKIKAINVQLGKDLEALDKTHKEKKILNVNEVKEIELSTLADTVANKKKILDNQAKQEIADINKNVKNKADAEKLILKIYQDLAFAKTKLDKDAFQNAFVLNGKELELIKTHSSFEVLTRDYTAKELLKIEESNSKLVENLKDAQAKAEDARRVVDKMSSAKTAAEKYAIVLEYGRKTSDEMLAQEVKRLDDQRKYFRMQVDLYATIFGTNSKAYQDLNTKLLKIDADFYKAKGSLYQKASTELLKIWSQEEALRRKNLSETLKTVTDTFKNMSSVQDKFLDTTITSFRESYKQQVDLLGDNTKAKIELLKKYQNKEEELIYGANQLRNYASFFSSLIGQYEKFNQQMFQIQDTYNNKIASIQNELNAGIISSEEAASKKREAGFTKNLSVISSAAQGVVSLVSSVIDAGYKADLEKLDRQKQNVQQFYSYQEELLKKDYDNYISAIQARDKAKLDSIDSIEKAELDSLNKLEDQKVAIISTKSTEQLDTIKRNLDDTQTERQRKYEDDVTKSQQAEEDKLADLKKKLQDGLITQDQYDAQETEIKRNGDAERTALKRTFEDDQTKLQRDYEAQRTQIQQDAENEKLRIHEEAEKQKTEISAKYEAQRTAITQQGVNDKNAADAAYNANMLALKQQELQQIDNIEKQKFEINKAQAKAQIIQQMILGEAALLPLYANPVTLPLAIAGAVAIATAGGILLSNISDTKYQSVISGDWAAGINPGKSGGIGPNGERASDWFKLSEAEKTQKYLAYLTAKEGNINGNSEEKFNKYVEEMTVAAYEDLWKSDGKAAMQRYLSDNPSDSESNVLKLNPNAPFKSGSAKASQPKQKGADGHEMAIDEFSYGLQQLPIYEWLVIAPSGGKGWRVKPRTEAWFAEGTEYVDLDGRYPAGRDNVPAYYQPSGEIMAIDRGERIIPTFLNEKLKGVSNKDLVDGFEYFRTIRESFPNLMDSMTSNYSMIFPEMQSVRKDDRTLNAILKLNETLDKKKMLNVQIDSSKVTLDEIGAGYKTRYLENIYNKKM